jgi:hypothetical protein
MAQQPVEDQFIYEMSLPTLTTFLGGAAGLPLAPLTGGASVYLGAGGGGYAGEYLAQLLGVNPRDNTMMALAGAAPLVGPIGARGAKLLGRGASALARANPVVKSAERVMTEESAVREFGNVNAALIAKLQHRGLISYPASRLYQIIDDVGVTVTPNQFTGTFKTLRRQRLLKNWLIT